MRGWENSGGGGEFSSSLADRFHPSLVIQGVADTHSGIRTHNSHTYTSRGQENTLFERKYKHNKRLELKGV